MLTETAETCLWLSDGQIAVEGRLFQETLKESVGWKQGNSSEAHFYLNWAFLEMEAKLLA